MKREKTKDLQYGEERSDELPPVAVINGYIGMPKGTRYIIDEGGVHAIAKQEQ
jgi:hypothetical protein